MRCLVHQRTSLGDTSLVFSTSLLILTLRGGNLRVSIGIVRLHAKVADILDDIYLKTHVLGITQVVGHIISISATAYFAIRCHKHLFNRVFQVFIEYTCKNLLGLAREPFPAQVDIVDTGTFQIRISFLHIFLAHNLIRHNLVESRSIDRTIVREAHIHLLRWCPLDRCRRQIVPIALFAHLPHAAELLEHGVYLVSMLGTKTYIHFA